MARSVNIGKGSGISTIYFAWVDGNGTRHPEGTGTITSTGTLSNCDHVWIESVVMSSGYTYPITVYSTNSGVGDIADYYSTSINLTLWPDDFAGNIRVKATSQPNYTYYYGYQVYINGSYHRSTGILSKADPSPNGTSIRLADAQIEAASIIPAGATYDSCAAGQYATFSNGYFTFTSRTNTSEGCSIGILYYTLPSYTCSVSKGTGISTATVNGNSTSASVLSGGTAQYRATLQTGYDWDAWYEDDEAAYSAQSLDLTVVRNVSLQARGKKKTFTCSAGAGTGITSATVNGVGSYTAEYGEQVQFRAVVDDGYVWDGWYQDGQKVTSTRNYNPTIYSNTGLEARATYQPIQYVNLTATPGTGIGSVSISASGYTPSSFLSVPKGTSVSYSATVQSDFTFDGWYENDVSISNSNPYGFTANVSRSLVAKANRTVHTASAYSIGFGCCFSSVGVSSSTFTYGDSLTFTAVMNTGYSFRGWYTSNGTLVSSNRIYTTTGGTSDITLYARADFEWTWSKTTGSSIISAEEFSRLQDYITQRNQYSFSSTPQAGESLSASYYNLLRTAIGSGSSVVRFQAISAFLLNQLRDNANDL